LTICVSASATKPCVTFIPTQNVIDFDLTLAECRSRAQRVPFNTLHALV
jgi:hypothetical protein